MGIWTKRQHYVFEISSNLFLASSRYMVSSLLHPINGKRSKELAKFQRIDRMPAPNWPHSNLIHNTLKYNAWKNENNVLRRNS